VLTYDEQTLAERLADLSHPELAAFAAACAERLMVVLDSIAGEAASPVVACGRAALDLAWSDSASRDQVEQALPDVEALVPDEDDETIGPNVALVQNAIASVAYALRARLSPSVQEAVWAARQLYEAGDFIVQRGAANHSYVSNLDRQAPIQIVLQGMESALRDAKSGSFTQLRSRAEADGRALVASYMAP